MVDEQVIIGFKGTVLNFKVSRNCNNFKQHSLVAIEKFVNVFR